jgi:hypothetical protein
MVNNVEGYEKSFCPKKYGFVKSSDSAELHDQEKREVGMLINSNYRKMCKY